MVLKREITAAIEKMILSASGWRGIFAESGDEECKSDKISAAHKVISAAAALIFADFLRSLLSTDSSQIPTAHCSLPAIPTILLGTDTRPTGTAIADAMIPVLLNAGCNVRYAGITAAPEIMAWARSGKKNVSGFIYISASHNPIGFNGFKFGLTDGGVLAADESKKLITNFLEFIEKDDFIEKIKSLMVIAESEHLTNIYSGINTAKTESYKTYYDFCGDVVWGGSADITSALKDALAKNPLGIVCDFNGSARTVSIDKEFFSALGFQFESINAQSGQIVHRIVPEGESLEPCRLFLEQTHKKDTSFVLGYMPDCDGDRGNLVIWDDDICKTRALEAQEVFALACVAELSHLVWTGELPGKAAVAINDPTSMRIDRITEAFGISVFRAEVGEANVVSLARRLREEGYLVRILGEGSAGGNITHPSAVRDPINTVLAIAKMLLIRSSCCKPGLFEIWCRLSGQSEKYCEDFYLSDFIATLPAFITTSAYSEDAILRIKTNDHAILKDRYQQIFLRDWNIKKDELQTRFGIFRWEAIAYNGMIEKRSLKHFKEAGRGGLKILFSNADGKEIAYIWMRGSATEPVFRIMAVVCLSDVNDEYAERSLLDWQRCMIMEADNK